MHAGVVDEDVYPSGFSRNRLDAPGYGIRVRLRA